MEHQNLSLTANVGGLISMSVVSLYLSLNVGGCIRLSVTAQGALPPEPPDGRSTGCRGFLGAPRAPPDPIGWLGLWGSLLGR